MGELIDAATMGFAFDLPPEKAVEYFKKKGNTFSWLWHDVFEQQHAQTFTVAKVMDADILQTIRDQVDKAIEDGISLTQFKSDLKPQLQKLGWWGTKTVETPGGASQEVQLGSPYRLETIFNTNIQTAYMAGHYDFMMESKNERPYWKYVAILDDRTRPEHRALHNKVFRYDDPFWKTHYPPNGWNCRCMVIAMTYDEVIAEGLTIESSDGRMVSREMPIPNTDRYVTVWGLKGVEVNGKMLTVWTDIGWSYNVGEAAFKPDLSKYDKPIRSNLEKGLNQ